MDGGCLSSPRWTSLLVAEIFYPDTFLEENQNSRFSGLRDTAGSPPPVHDFQNYQQYLQKRAGENEARNSGSQHHCDGVDEMGCFQVIRELRIFRPGFESKRKENYPNFLTPYVCDIGEIVLRLVPGARKLQVLASRLFQPLRPAKRLEC